VDRLAEPTLVMSGVPANGKRWPRSISSTVLASSIAASSLGFKASGRNATGSMYGPEKAVDGAARAVSSLGTGAATQTACGFSFT
jgi:hypothetical protein